MRVVTFIGGPADMERRAIDERRDTYEVAELPRLHWEKEPGWPETQNCAVVKHTYDLREVGRNTWVAVHRSLM